MSEKLSSSEPAVESDEKLMENAHGSKELMEEEKPKRKMEYAEALRPYVATVAAEHWFPEDPEDPFEDPEDSSEDPEDPFDDLKYYPKFRRLAVPKTLTKIDDSEVAKICQQSLRERKRALEITQDFFDTDSEDYEDSEDSEDPEDPEVPKICQLPKTTSEIEDPEVAKICLQSAKERERAIEAAKKFFGTDSKDYEDPEVPKICQLPKTTSEISTSNKLEDLEDPEVAKISLCSSKEKKQIPEDSEDPVNSEDPEDPKVPKICQLPKTTSEISTSNKPEDPEVAKICLCFSKGMKQIPENPEVPKICRLPKTTSEISTFKILEDPEDPEVPKICQLPKTTSEISTSIEEDIPKVPKVCQLPETSEISTSVKFGTSEIPDVCSTTLSEISSVKFTDPEISEYQLPKAMSEISTSKLDSKIPEICQLPKTVSEISTSIKSEAPKVPKASQLRKTTSEISTSSKPEDPEIPEEDQICDIWESVALKHGAFKFPEVYEFPKITSKIPTSNKPEDSETLKKKDSETLKKEDSDSDDSLSDYIISQQTMVERVPYYGRPPKLPNESEREFRIRIVEQMKPIGYFDNELEEIRHLTRWTSLNKSKSLKKSEESSLPDDEDKTKLTPIVSGERPFNTLNKFWAPLGAPNFKKRPLVLATYQLVPSLPIRLFEMFAEIIEYVTYRPVVLLHECRYHRPIPSEIADIVVMPAAYNWDEGVLLPASFVFKHEQNKDKTANMYADVIVAKDCAPHIKSIINLRGRTFALPIQRGELTVSDLLFNFLHAKGENLLFFGNIIDTRTQIDVLDMVANNQVAAGVLDSPVVECNKYNIQGVTMKSLQVLSSLGPLPPYRIMVKKTQADELVEELVNYLLTGLDDLWLERLLTQGVLGFAENSMDKYKYVDPKAVRTRRHYY